MNPVTRFLESADEAIVSVNISGTPATVQRAIKQMAKKVAGKGKKKGVDAFVSTAPAEKEKSKEPVKEDLQRDLSYVEAWLKDANNAIGEGCQDWDWDSDTRMLTVINDDGSASTFSAKDIGLK